MNFRSSKAQLNGLVGKFIFERQRRFLPLSDPPPPKDDSQHEQTDANDDRYVRRLKGGLYQADTDGRKQHERGKAWAIV